MPQSNRIAILSGRVLPPLIGTVAGAYLFTLGWSTGGMGYALSLLGAVSFLTGSYCLYTIKNENMEQTAQVLPVQLHPASEQEQTTDQSALNSELVEKFNKVMDAYDVALKLGTITVRSNKHVKDEIQAIYLEKDVPFNEEQINKDIDSLHQQYVRNKQRRELPGLTRAEIQQTAQTMFVYQLANRCEKDILKRIPSQSEEPRQPRSRRTSRA